MDEDAVRRRLIEMNLPAPSELRVKEGKGERAGQNYAFASYDSQQDKDFMLTTLFKWPDGRLCLCKVSQAAKKRRTFHPPLWQQLRGGNRTPGRILDGGKGGGDPM